MNTEIDKEKFSDIKIVGEKTYCTSQNPKVFLYDSNKNFIKVDNLKEIMSASETVVPVGSYAKVKLDK